MPQETAERRDSVETPSIAYKRMATKWELIHDLLAGTRGMRDAASRWLPQETAESRGSYISRLNRSILFEGYRNSVDRAVSRPFARPVTVKEAPEIVGFIEDDSDACGLSISQFARAIFEDLVIYGKAHIFVDFASVPENADPEQQATIAQEKEANARATLVRVSPPALIGWLASKGEGQSQPRLDQIRIMEKTTERIEGAEFIDRQVTRIRVVNPDSFQVWRKLDKPKDNGKEFELEAEGPMSLGEIPLVTVYANKTGFMEADPPMEAVAWLNLAHWQSDSDQRNILRISRFAILFAKGISKEEAEKGFTIGPFNTISSSSDKADLKYVEHNGTAIKAGSDDLRDLEARMEVMGMAPFVERSAQSTATGKAIDEAGAMTKAQDWVRSLEDGLVEAYSLAMKWHKAGDLPKDFGVDIFSDFKVSATTSDLDFLLRATQGGTLSLVTFLNEIKRRGQLADSVDPEEEVERIQEEQLPSIDDIPDLDDLDE